MNNKWIIMNIVDFYSGKSLKYKESVCVGRYMFPILGSLIYVFKLGKKHVWNHDVFVLFLRKNHQTFQVPKMEESSTI